MSWDTYPRLFSHAKLDKLSPSTKNPHSQAHKAINNKNKVIWFDSCQLIFINDFQIFLCASNPSISCIRASNPSISCILHHPPNRSNIWSKLLIQLDFVNGEFSPLSLFYLLFFCFFSLFSFVMEHFFNFLILFSFFN